jgi:hypothetical protein
MEIKINPKVAPPNVALCLYGQPRNLEKGFKTINKFILPHNPDVFFHTWKIKETETFESSPWRPVDRSYKNPDNAVTLYTPKSYIIEEAKTFEPNGTILSSKGYDKTQNKNNISNTFSQMYSRKKVRDIFLEYTKTNNVVYDIVVMCRFDIYILELNLGSLQPGFIYFKYYEFLKDRPYIFADSLIISNQKDFIDLFNLEVEKYIMKGPDNTGSKPLDEDLYNISEGTRINAEELLSASILDHGLFERCKSIKEIDFVFADQV